MVHPHPLARRRGKGVTSRKARADTGVRAAAGGATRSWLGGSRLVGAVGAIVLAACGAEPSSGGGAASDGGPDDHPFADGGGGAGGHGGVGDGGGQGGSGGAQPRTAAGFWQRVKSALGRETDVAFGAIRDEPANRVLMCERPPSPSAGLYSGTLLGGSVIHWDDRFGLPDYDVVFLGDFEMTFHPRLGGEVQLGDYAPGPWRSDSCGYMPVEDEIGLSKWSGWVEAQDSASARLVSVAVDGVDLPILSIGATCSGPPLPPAPKSGARNVTIRVDQHGTMSDVQTTLPQAGFHEGCNRIVVATGAQCGGAPACASVGDPPDPPVVEVVATLPHLDDFDLDGTEAYFADGQYGVYRCSLAGCGAPALLSGVGGIFYELQAEQGRIFFSDTWRVQSCVVSGGTCAASEIARAADPSSVAIGPLETGNGRVYWVDGSTPGGATVRSCPVTGCTSGYPKDVIAGAADFAVASDALYRLAFDAGAPEGIVERVPLASPDAANVGGAKELWRSSPDCFVSQIELDPATSTLFWLQGCGAQLVLRSCVAPSCSTPKEVARFPVAQLATTAQRFRVNATHVYYSRANGSGNAIEIVRFAR